MDVWTDGWIDGYKEEVPDFLTLIITSSTHAMSEEMDGHDKTRR